MTTQPTPALLLFEWRLLRDEVPFLFFFFFSSPPFAFLFPLFAEDASLGDLLLDDLLFGLFDVEDDDPRVRLCHID
jgi:hypothetical protein